MTYKVGQKVKVTDGRVGQPGKILTIKEVTLAEVAKAMNIPVSKLRIKDE